MNARSPASQDDNWVLLNAALGHRGNSLNNFFFFAHSLISASGFPAASAFM